MIDFKGFLDRAKEGDVRHELFVVKSVASMREHMYRLSDQANETGLVTHMHGSKSEVSVGNATAVFRVFHDRIGDRLQGWLFNDAWVDELVHMPDSALAEIKARVRL